MSGCQIRPTLTSEQKVWRPEKAIISSFITFVTFITGKKPISPRILFLKYESSIGKPSRCKKSFGWKLIQLAWIFIIHSISCPWFCRWIEWIKKIYIFSWAFKIKVDPIFNFYSLSPYCVRLQKHCPICGLTELIWFRPLLRAFYFSYQINVQNITKSQKIIATSERKSEEITPRRMKLLSSWVCNY